jgi:hypothetical protein
METPCISRQQPQRVLAPIVARLCPALNILDQSVEQPAVIGTILTRALASGNSMHGTAQNDGKVGKCYNPQ